MRAVRLSARAVAIRRLDWVRKIPFLRLVHSHGCWQEAQVSFLILGTSLHSHDMTADFPRERDGGRGRRQGTGGHSIIDSRIFFETPVKSFPSFHAYKSNEECLHHMYQIYILPFCFCCLRKNSFVILNDSIEIQMSFVGIFSSLST